MLQTQAYSSTATVYTHMCIRMRLQPPLSPSELAKTTSVSHPVSYRPLYSYIETRLWVSAAACTGLFTTEARQVAVKTTIIQTANFDARPHRTDS